MIGFPECNECGFNHDKNDKCKGILALKEVFKNTVGKTVSKNEAPHLNRKSRRNLYKLRSRIFKKIKKRGK